MQPEQQAEHEFEAILEAGDGDGGVFVAIPFVVAEVYGTRGRVPIQATIDGFPYQGSLTPLGDGHHGLLVLKQIRRAIDKTVGDVVRVTLSRDVVERKVEMPTDLAAALADKPGASANFAKLAYTDQREYVRWIEGAKKPETRQRRLQETVARLAQGRKRA
jgi:CRISPR/Cas system-associated endonuclease Cas1